MVEQATQPIGEPFSTWPEYVAEAEAIIAAAGERGLHLRLLGALAVIKQCPGGVWLLEKTNRVLTDLDFMGYEKEIGKVEAMFGELGYEILGGRGVTMDVWVGRRIFHDPAGQRRRVDVFLDRLDFCHPIELKGRLELGGHEYGAGQMLVFAGGSDPILKALEPSTVMLLGGEPLGPRHIWWNFVSSRKDRIEQAKADWKAGRIRLPMDDDREFIPLPEEPRPSPEPMS